MKKHFGQHLLVDQNHLKKIINYVELRPTDIVLEIGAGSGLLTCLIAKTVKKVFAVELERSILRRLKSNIENNKLANITVIEKDFLKLNINELMEDSSDSVLTVVGNIPYNITSKILLKLFGEIDNVAPHLKLLKKVYLMLQLEVAKRLVAKPHSKAYSPLTLLVQFFSNPEILFVVPRKAFYPTPKVDSAFVSFYIKKSVPVPQNPTALKKIIRVSFQQRRKKIVNALNKLCEDKAVIERVFDKLKLDYNLRAEDLSIENYISIADEIYAV